jgi:hypothetical protein
MWRPGYWMKSLEKLLIRTVLLHTQKCWWLSHEEEARVEVREREKEVEANQRASMLILCAITAMRRATSSGTLNNGRRTKRRSKFRNKPTVIVTVREVVFLQLSRLCFSCMKNMMADLVLLLRRGSL